MNQQPSSQYMNKESAKMLVEKWAPILDAKSAKIAPIEDSHTRLSTAMLLENQEKWCIQEASNIAGGTGGVFSGGSVDAGAYGGSVGNNDFYATGDSRLPKILIPMIRRTFPELITNEICGVQPMSGPVGLAFALRYRYESDPLATYSPDGGSNVNGSTPGTSRPWRTPADGVEVGWNYLDTRFTGTSSAKLSGSTDFEMLANDNGVAEILANFELTTNIPQMVIQFEKTAVEAGTRRLATKWSLELEQDVRNMQGIDIDNEMVNAMSYEIQAEIDREMIMRMVQISLNAGYGQGFSFWDAASADARWTGERGVSFYQKVLVEANRVAVRNRRGPANFIVATPRVCAMLEMLPEMKFFPVNSSVSTQGVGVSKVGQLAGRFNVYRDTRTDAQWMVGQRANPLEYCLLGYKGSEYYDTGIVYCPYIPVMVQRTVGPNDFAPRVGLMTRYGVVDHIFGAQLYYHTIIVRGLGTAFTPGNAAVYM